jgi:hypothetical protein
MGKHVTWKWQMKKEEGFQKTLQMGLFLSGL